MKTTGIKSWFRDVITLPILLAILIAETIAVAFRYVLARVNIKAFVKIMDGPTPWGTKAATLDCEAAKPEPPMSGRDHAVDFLTVLEASDEHVVAGARRLLERTGFGAPVAESWPDRHDYIVVAPTKAENLRRIANVFAVIPDMAREDVVNLLRRSCWRYGDGNSLEA